MIASGVAFNRVAIAHRSVRIACGTPNCERIRAAHEVRRKVLVEKRAAPAMYRDRLLLHAAATDSAGRPSSTDSSAVSSAFAAIPAARTLRRSRRTRQRVGSSSYGSISVCKHTSPSSSAVGAAFCAPSGSSTIS